jgi:hypothetical protein
MSKLEKIIGIVAIIVIAFCVLVLFPRLAKAQVIISVPVEQSQYQACIDTCLAYNGYTSDVYSFCQNECLYPYPVGVVVVGGGFWYHGRFFHGHDYPRRDVPHYHHDEPRYHR